MVTDFLACQQLIFDLDSVPGLDKEEEEEEEETVKAKRDDNKEEGSAITSFAGVGTCRRRLCAARHARPVTSRSVFGGIPSSHYVQHVWRGSGRDARTLTTPLHPVCCNRLVLSSRGRRSHPPPFCTAIWCGLSKGRRFLLRCVSESVRRQLRTRRTNPCPTVWGALANELLLSVSPTALPSPTASFSSSPSSFTAYAGVLSTRARSRLLLALKAEVVHPSTLNGDEDQAIKRAQAHACRFLRLCAAWPELLCVCEERSRTNNVEGHYMNYNYMGYNYMGI